MAAVVTGLEDVLKELRRVDRQFNSKVLRPAVNKGLDPVRKQAKALCKHESIRKLIAKKSFISKRDKAVRGKVFIKPSKDRKIILEGREVGFEAVASILEFGRKKGDLKPDPFLRPALDIAQGAALKIVASESSERIKRL